ncbi:hypothetical protein G6F40_016653 [Rhizopus arrhizus]|nr:hypothetical protein G6F40_016653 [Rhizopus arrhizus]
MTDPMTQLLNRRGVASELARLMASRQAFAVLALDLDHFKQVNDTFGHAAGDQVLMTLADIMRGSVRAEDACCRVGGEEFLDSRGHPRARDAGRRGPCHRLDRSRPLA